MLCYATPRVPNGENTVYHTIVRARICSAIPCNASLLSHHVSVTRPHPTYSQSYALLCNEVLYCRVPSFNDQTVHRTYGLCYATICYAMHCHHGCSDPTTRHDAE
eukprot:4235081-Pyramimonas_sp.AAC.1